MIYKSPIGDLFLQFENEYLTGLYFDDTESTIDYNENTVNNCIKQLDEYFNGERLEFDIKIKLIGTDFRKNVWNALKQIPYGQTCSYKDMACMVGNPKAVRAVGGANHANPVSIILPCHRVIGADGSLTGYGGGLWRKEWLLAHEKEVIRNRHCL